MNHFHYIYSPKSVVIPTISDFLNHKVFIIPIWDQYIIDICSKTRSGKYSPVKLSKPYIHKYPGVEKYLSIRYTDSASNSETIWRIKLGIEERPTCPICGGRVNYLGTGHYSIHCGARCQMLDPKTKETYHKNLTEKYGEDVVNVFQLKNIKDKIKNTNKERYGFEYNFQNPTIKEKIKNTYLEKYGVDNYTKTDEFKNKFKKTCLTKYGVDNPNKTKTVRDKIKNTCLERYGVTCVIQIPENLKKATSIESREKGYETRKKRQILKSSKREQLLFKYLKEEYGENNVINAYKDERYIRADGYKYECDFYIPSLDLFIEYNGNWTHGYHPYNKNNISDSNTLKTWIDKNTKYYNSAIYVWTESDLNKRKVAKENNLKYLEIWPLDWVGKNPIEEFKTVKQKIESI